MIHTITSNFLFTQGRTHLAIIAVIGLIGILLFTPMLYLALGTFIFCFYFFRNPERSCPQASLDQAIIVSPADGKIIDIQYSENNGFEGYAYKISIFLSVFDVHVNRCPSGGTINHIEHKKGQFVPAYVPKSSDLNERNDLVITPDTGTRYRVRQIAGIVARRIVCFAKEGERLTTGQRYGMIKFGSRVDILVSKDVTIYSTKGDRVYGGQTIIGRWL